MGTHKHFGQIPQADVAGLSTTLAGKSDVAHTHTGSHTHLVLNPPVAQAYAASLTPDAALGNYRVITATGDLTLNPPTNPADGQMWRARVIASGAARALTFASGLRRPAHIGATLSIASGRRGDIGLLYEAADSAWTVLAAQTA